MKKNLAYLFLIIAFLSETKMFSMTKTINPKNATTPRTSNAKAASKNPFSDTDFLKELEEFEKNPELQKQFEEMFKDENFMKELEKQMEELLNDPKFMSEFEAQMKELEKSEEFKKFADDFTKNIEDANKINQKEVTANKSLPSISKINQAEVDLQKTLVSINQSIETLNNAITDNILAEKLPDLYKELIATFENWGKKYTLDSFNHGITSLKNTNNINKLLTNEYKSLVDLLKISQSSLLAPSNDFKNILPKTFGLTKSEISDYNTGKKKNIIISSFKNLLKEFDSQFKNSKTQIEEFLRTNDKPNFKQIQEIEAAASKGKNDTLQYAKKQASTVNLNLTPSKNNTSPSAIEDKQIYSAPSFGSKDSAVQQNTNRSFKKPEVKAGSIGTSTAKNTNKQKSKETPESEKTFSPLQTKLNSIEDLSDQIKDEKIITEIENLFQGLIALKTPKFTEDNNKSSSSEEKAEAQSIFDKKQISLLDSNLNSKKVISLINSLSIPSSDFSSLNKKELEDLQKDALLTQVTSQINNIANLISEKAKISDKIIEANSLNLLSPESKRVYLNNYSESISNLKNSSESLSKNWNQYNKQLEKALKRINKKIIKSSSQKTQKPNKKNNFEKNSD